MFICKLGERKIAPRAVQLRGVQRTREVCADVFKDHVCVWVPVHAINNPIHCNE